MEKICCIIAEICAVLLSILCVYHYFSIDSDGMILLFSLMFAVMALWCHKIQKDIKFDFKLW